MCISPTSLNLLHYETPIFPIRLTKEPVKNYPDRDTAYRYDLTPSARLAYVQPKPTGICLVPPGYGTAQSPRMRAEISQGENGSNRLPFAKHDSESRYGFCQETVPAVLEE